MESEFVGTERFVVEASIGEGGMGAVYRAYDRELERHVALKVLLRLGADALLRFKQEFRALQDLSHPNLVSLGELVESEGHWFFSMELVEGMDFLGHVRGISQPDDDAVADTLQLRTDVERDRQSKTSHVVGTAAYMAPEQAASGDIGPAADWYSVGVLLYECLWERSSPLREIRSGRGARSGDGFQCRIVFAIYHLFFIMLRK